MDHYLDIKLLLDPEFPIHQLMDALFAKLHRALVCLESADIGVSFPEARSARSGLGRVLRLHGPAQSLARLAGSDWLVGMRDHIEFTLPTTVPSTATPICVRRVQAKSNPERLRRRQMKRKGWTEEQARAAIPDAAMERLDLPFLTVRSSSTGQPFRLFVLQQSVGEASSGSFNAYGFSTTATLPTF